jgi:hypothetical protein
MKLPAAIALTALVTPLAALAQTSYSHATITGPTPVPPPVYVETVPVYVPGHLHMCEARNDALWDRKALLDQDKADIDREGRSISQESAQVNEQLRNLDHTDTVAVAAYNVRQRAFNERVEAHNRRVADMNGAAALLNADAADLTSYCNRIRYVMR